MQKKQLLWSVKGCSAPSGYLILQFSSVCSDGNRSFGGGGFFFFWGGGDLLQIILQFRTALTASHSMQQTEQCYLLCKALCESCRCMQHSQNSLQNVWWALAMSFSLWRLLIRERWLWPGLQGETSPVFTCLGDDVSEGSGIGFILLKARLRCAGKCGSI